MDAPTYRGRFAPSPSGPLHFGSLVAALASYADALNRGGEWYLRIDDVDRARTRAGARDAILRSLEAFGFRWQAGVMEQSAREERYRAVLQTLLDAGLVYPCTCSRREVAAVARRGPEGPVYPGTCRGGPSHPGRKPAYRIRTRHHLVGVRDRIQGVLAQDVAQEVGDFIVRRADGFTAYQLAVVVDDADQGITDVVRGADLLRSTPRQCYLQQCLGLPRPGYAHVPLVIDATGRKLSKRDAAHPLDDGDPLPALRRAWHFLGQDSPGAAATTDEFWDMAKTHWNIARIRQ